MKRRKLTRPKHRPSSEVDPHPSSPSTSSSSSSRNTKHVSVVEKHPTSLTDHIPDKPPKPPQEAYKQLTSPSGSSSDSPHPNHQYLNIEHEYLNLPNQQSEEHQYQNIHEETASSQDLHAERGEGEINVSLSDLDIQKICSEIVSTLGNLGADVAGISSSGKYKRDGNSANLALNSSSSTLASDTRAASLASSRHCSVHSLHSVSGSAPAKQTDKTPGHVITNTADHVTPPASPSQFVNKELINSNYSVSLSSQLSVALSSSIPCSDTSPVLSTPSPALLTLSACSDNTTCSDHTTRACRDLERGQCCSPPVKYSHDKPPKHPQKPLRYIRKRSLKFKRVKKKFKKRQEIIRPVSVPDSSGQSRSSLINKLITLYRKLQQRCKLLETLPQKPNQDFHQIPHQIRSCYDLDDIALIKRYMNACYTMLKQQLSTYNKDSLLERDVKVFQMDDIPTRVDRSRNKIRPNSLPSDTLFEYLFRREPLKPAALAVKYDRHVRIPSMEVCRRIFKEASAISEKKSNDALAVEHKENLCNPTDVLSINDGRQKPTPTDLSRQSPIYEFSQQYFTSSSCLRNSCRSQVKTFRITERSEKSSGAVSVKDHYVSAVSWIKNNKIYVGS